MAVAANADDYAATRVGIFFPGVNPTLDGQCVSLEKWFLGEMCGVSDWNAARGNANTCGRTLVNQGLAYEVPYGQRRRGDVVCLEYGQYGHVYIQLSGGRVFEENVNMPGVTRRLVDGDYVYSSRIGSDQEPWRIAAGKNPHVYRLRGYAEAGATNDKGDDDMIPDADNYYWRYGQKTAQAIRGRQLSREEFSKNIAGVSGTRALEILEDNPEADQAAGDLTLGQLARRDNWQGQIYGLIDQVNALGSRPTKEQLDAVTKQAADFKAAADAATVAADQAKADAEQARKTVAELRAQQEEDQATGNSFLRWLGNLLKGNK